MPYGLEAELEFIRTILMSAWVKNEKALSGLIVSLPDTGKSESLMQFGNNRGIVVLNDFTGYGLSKLLGQIQIGTIRTIIIPDFLRILEGRSNKVTSDVISILNSISEEGLKGIITFNIQFTSDKPIKCGFLTSLTLDSFNRRRCWFSKLGFTSRLIPFFFGYNREDLEKAIATIKAGKKVFVEEKLPVPEQEVEIEIEDKFKDEVEKVARFTSTINRDFTAFRTLKNMITLTKAHALLRGRDEVDKSDIIFLKSLVPFWFNPIVGNDCDYKIILNLPSTSKELIRKLPYSKSLIYERIKELKERKVLTDANGKITTNY